MTKDPTPEQIEAAYQAWLKFPHKRGQGNAKDAIHAALVAAAGALLVAPDLPIREDSGQRGDTDRSGGEDGPEHEWGGHPEAVAADTAELITEARALAGRKVEDSADAEALQIMLGLLCDRLAAPTRVDEVGFASLLQQHRPSQWRSFANDTIIYRCCRQDFGRLTGKPRKADRDPRELWEEHMASKLAEWLRGGGQ